MKCITEMGSGGIIYIPSFMKICTGIRIILRFYLQQFENLYFGIIEGRNL
jgi:hypothetical protein